MTTDDREFARRIELAEAVDMAAFAAELAQVAPELRAVTFPLVDGHAVLTGKGMYVNGALAVGIDRVPTADEFDQWESACAHVGVAPSFEVHEHSHPDLVPAIEARGYALEPDSLRTGLVLSQSSYSPRAVSEDIEVVQVTTPSLVETWKELTAAGWGHETPERRAVSDRFTDVAARIQKPGLFLAVERSTGRPIGCANLSFLGETALLGGMSTLPAERGRGVQSALIQHRLRLAWRSGRSLAATHAKPGEGSIRNLERAGFKPVLTKATYERPLSNAS